MGHSVVGRVRLSSACDVGLRSEYRRRDTVEPESCRNVPTPEVCGRVRPAPFPNRTTPSSPCSERQPRRARRVTPPGVVRAQPPAASSREPWKTHRPRSRGVWILGGCSSVCRPPQCAFARTKIVYGATDEWSTESVFLRPKTNQTASTVSSPIVANRCGWVQSNEMVSPGPSS